MHLEFITKHARRPARKGEMQVYCINVQENTQKRGYGVYRVKQSNDFPGNGKGRAIAKPYTTNCIHQN